MTNTVDAANPPDSISSQQTPVLTLLIGNPRLGSRTRLVADALADAIRATADSALAEGAVVEVATAVGVTLTAEPVAATSPVTDLVATLGSPGILLVASPAYKGTITGQLKIILDQFAPGDLDKVLAVPVAVAGSQAHGDRTAADLATILTELGATVTSPLVLTEDQLDGAPERARAWAQAETSTINEHHALQGGR